MHLHGLLLSSKVEDLMGEKLKKSEGYSCDFVQRVLLLYVYSYLLLLGLSPMIWCLPLQYHSRSVASLDPETM